jgi:hypothetical protein
MKASGLMEIITDMVDSFTPMEIYTLACGNMIQKMDMENFIGLSKEICIKENGRMEICMGKESSHGKVVRPMKDHGKMVI